MKQNKMTNKQSKLLLGLVCILSLNYFFQEKSYLGITKDFNSGSYEMMSVKEQLDVQLDQKKQELKSLELAHEAATKSTACKNEDCKKLNSNLVDQISKLKDSVSALSKAIEYVQKSDLAPNLEKLSEIVACKNKKDSDKTKCEEKEKQKKMVADFRSQMKNATKECSSKALKDSDQTKAECLAEKLKEVMDNFSDEDVITDSIKLAEFSKYFSDPFSAEISEKSGDIPSQAKLFQSVFEIFGDNSLIQKGLLSFMSKIAKNEAADIIKIYDEAKALQVTNPNESTRLYMQANQAESEFGMSLKSQTEALQQAASQSFDLNTFIKRNYLPDLNRIYASVNNAKTSFFTDLNAQAKTINENRDRRNAQIANASRNGRLNSSNGFANNGGNVSGQGVRWSTVKNNGKVQVDPGKLNSGRSGSQLGNNIGGTPDL